MLARKIFQKIAFLILAAIVVFLFLYKLNYEFFFTDEILYLNSGIEYLRGEFTLSIQAPFIGKYIAGIASLFSQRDLFVLRLPFAILGIISAAVVYFIIKKTGIGGMGMGGMDGVRENGYYLY